MDPSAVSLGARLLVAAVLAFSGVSKLASPAAVTAAAADLGVGPRLARWAGRALAPAEIAVALLLLPARTAYAAAAAALALFAVFAALIAWNLAHGRRPSCACFGEPAAAPIGAWTLARDLGLLAVSSLVVLAGPAAAGHGLLAGAASVVAAAGVETALAAIALLVLLETGLLALLLARRERPAPERAEGGAASEEAARPAGWPPGTLAPSFDLPSLEGERITLPGLLARGRDVVLVFTDPACRPCNALLPEIGRWQERYGLALTIAVVSQGTPAANGARSREHGLRSVLLQGRREVAEAYRCEQTPAAVAIDRNGRIASRAARGGTAIRELVVGTAELAARDAPASVDSPPPPLEASRISPGDPAPPFRLPALAGGDVDLFELAGRVAVLVFWSPSCGHCARLLPELLAWERSQTGESARLVVLSTGGRVANSRLGFRSPVLLDDGGLVSRAYGVEGTPSGLLVDAESRVASGLAEGDAALTALLRRADALARAAQRLAAAG